MILYEVTVTAEPHLRDAFATYTRTKHIREVLATGCFVSAQFASAESGAFRTSYVASTQEDLDRYLEQHAARMRADFAAHFPSGVAVSRANWEVLEESERRRPGG